MNWKKFFQSEQPRLFKELGIAEQKLKSVEDTEIDKALAERAKRDKERWERATMLYGTTYNPNTYGREASHRSMEEEAYKKKKREIMDQHAFDKLVKQGAEKMSRPLRSHKISVGWDELNEKIDMEKLGKIGFRQTQPIARHTTSMPTMLQISDELLNSFNSQNQEKKATSKFKVDDIVKINLSDGDMLYQPFPIVQRNGMEYMVTHVVDYGDGKHFGYRLNIGGGLDSWNFDERHLINRTPRPKIKAVDLLKMREQSGV